MGVDGKRGVAAQGFHAGQPAPVETGHDTCAAFGRYQIRMALHGVGLIGDIERHHHVLASLVAPFAQDGHHMWYAFRNGRTVGVGTDLIILDEIL